MILTSFFPLLLASLASFSAAQVQDSLDAHGPITLDAIHNATAITGTWSSGSQAVSSGPGFCDPVKLTFNYPKNTGLSYTFFTNDTGNFYEIARYRFKSNGSDPTCITGIIGWSHGEAFFNVNGSITLVPFGDGFQQIQDPCAAVSNFIETYNQTEYYVGWRIFEDPTFGPKLHLFNFDGSAVSPMFRVSATPNMFPIQLLRNNTFVTVSRRSVNGDDEEELSRRDSGATSVNVQPLVMGILGAAGLFASALVSMML